MRRLLAIAIAVLIALSSLSTAVAPANRVVNGGFETGDLTGWRIVGSQSGKVSVLATAARSGSYGLRLQGGGNNDIRQTFPEPILVSSITEIGYWCRNAQTGSPMEVDMLVHFTNGSYVVHFAFLNWNDLNWYYQNVTNTLKSEGWLKSDAQIDYIQLWCLGLEAQYAYVDDIVLVGDPAPPKSQDDGQTTPPNWPPKPPPKPPPSQTNDAQELIGQFLKQAAEALRRLLGNPMILLLLILFILIMSYYTTRRH